ncbi:MAG: heterodisulfide reductase-related iron-sulfur binding cluster [Deltaproteobacteria bacterium]
MSLRSLLVLVFTLIGFGIGFFNFFRLYQYLRLGKAENRFDHLFKRTKIFIINVLGQKRMFKDLLPGIAHTTIFWGFIVITVGTIELIMGGVIPGFNFSFLGDPVYSALLALQDIFYCFVLLAVFYFLFRRIVLKPKRLEILSRHSAWDAYLILTLIGILMVSGLLLTGSSGPLLQSIGFSQPSLRVISESSWWIHFLTVMGFLCYLPFSKHLHIVAAAPNVFFTTVGPRGRLKKIDLTDEKQTTFGAGKLEDFSWKQLLDSYACTECGRCNEFCPTYNTGKPLKPRSIIVDIRQHLQDKGDAIVTHQEDHPSLLKKLADDVISVDAIWDCTTCGACVEACPVFIEHVDAIVDMRRYLVLMEGKMEAEAQKTFANWETYSNPYGFSPQTRGEWAKEIGVKTLAENPDVEYLYYVGCAASFDKRAQKVAEAFSRLLRNAGVSFGILGDEERCNGETARRLGNEYLGQQLIDENKKVLNKYHVKKILTTCPHCFNTLKNEYPDFDARFEVYHHSTFLKKLIDEGKLKISKEIQKKMTYHDPCYMGRYNASFEEPRQILKQIPGAQVSEMRRINKKGFCCGAGGGRMWLEEKRGSRINVNRVEEALETAPQVIVSSCPFCLTMISDGLNAKNQEKTVSALDLAEILEQTVRL